MDEKDEKFGKPTPVKVEKQSSCARADFVGQAEDSETDEKFVNPPQVENTFEKRSSVAGADRVGEAEGSETDEKFGKLIPVELRNHWQNEAQDFTPWLSENLDRLGESVGMALELIGTEDPIGNFRADILARNNDEPEDSYVVIENQLGKTDHDHLGKLLTYAAGKSAKTVIWIAGEICEEHRKALDWLNENIENTAFFGVEVKLFTIGNSKPAPQFYLAAKPNDWAKQQIHQRSDLTPTQRSQWEFWKDWFQYMKKQGTDLDLRRKAKPQHWYPINVGKAGFSMTLTVNSAKNQIGCALSIRETKHGFPQLKNQKQDIEEKLGAKGRLEWQLLPDRKSSRIVQYKSGDFKDKDKDRQDKLFAWMKDRAETFHKVFSPLLKKLELEDEEENQL